MSGHKILFLGNLPDHKVDDEYSHIVRDVKSAVNKEYLNRKFLKKDKDETFFDLKGQLIKNPEPFNLSSYDDELWSKFSSRNDFRLHTNEGSALFAYYNPRQTSLGHRNVS